MPQDELQEISGFQPKVWLEDGEEREVGSATSKSIYKVKRTMDHYYCSCPAWRNQAGVPVNARTCKHLKSFLGDDYENARVLMKNPDGPPPKTTKSKAKPAAKSKPASKRKRTTAEEDNDEGDDAEEEIKPAKRGRKAAPVSKAKQSNPKQEDAEVDEEVKPAKQGRKAIVSKNATTELEAEVVIMTDDQNDMIPAVNADDELAEINGIKPIIYLNDGETHEVGSATSKTKYKVKRTFDHYYCSCPAWRNQARVPVNARTCKHLKAFLGEEYEEARLQLKNSDGSAPKPPSNAKGKTTTRTNTTESNNIKQGDVVPQTVTDREKDIGALTPPNGDELMEIDGVKPNVYLRDGDEQEVGSLTSNSKYKIKRTWDHYYCSCPAWRNQGGAPVNARTCKHLKSLLGEEYENARIAFKNPDGPQPKSPKKPSAKGTKKGKGKADEDDNVAEGDGVPELLLANKWDLDSGPDPTGWWVSEKLDGVRTYYDGKQMISRLGNPFTPPQWFLDKLPKDVTLDGELFTGRGEFQSTVSIVKTVNSPHWHSVTFQVFDIPSRGEEPFETRINILKELFSPGGTHHTEKVVVVEHEEVRDRQHVFDKLKEIESLGGEGLMLRKPQSVYEGHRSSSLLKIKTFYDAEAIVTGYVDGKGKYKGAKGALMCKMESGKTFNVGSGLSDKQRNKPPPIGSIIVYRFQELTKDGVPRFPTFVGIAADKDKPKDAEMPEHKCSKNEELDE